MAAAASPIDVTSLGALQTTHKRSVSSAVGPLVLAFLLPVAAAGLIYGVLRFVPASDRETLEKAWVLAAAAPIGSLFLLWSWFKNLGLRVDVHEHGFVLYRRSGAQMCRWEDAVELWSSCFDGNAPAYGRQPKKGYTIRRRDGWNIQLTSSLAGLEPLADRVRRETYARMMPWALSQFQAGGQVSFGMYSLSRMGLTVTAPQVSIGALMISCGMVPTTGGLVAVAAV